jgi:MGT family glycosyltransferase
VTDPIVLVTTSSEAQDDGRLVQVALDALAGEPFHVAATLPAGIRTSYRVPANAHSEEFIPHSTILSRSAVAVTHGGMGATQKALARGVPVCVVPFGRDQHEVAQRVRASGAGTTLKPARLTPERLRAAILEARERTDGARRVRDSFAAVGGPVAGADAIERRMRA